ncbi:RAVE subunit 2/Rogdi [Rhizophagus diaphanus]|nr:RAVE subunit 2/Rogdi [Rhizophagus diaphanus] [Rhizophagus sp. MUCL 43196]
MIYAEEDTQAIFQKEQEILVKELDWLLISQLPNALYEIKKGLKKCETIMKSPEHDDSLGTSTLPISSNNNDFLKGFITLDGSDVIKGELSVKLSNYNRGNLIKLTINPKKPYFIEQLVDAQNYLTLALDALERTSKDLTKESARELLDSVLIYIISSRSVLVCAHEEKLFPYKICDPQMFGTVIPEDLIIQFHVEGSNVVCSVYGLQYHSSLPSQKKTGGLLGTAKSSSNIWKYKDKYASVLDKVIVKSRDPKLEEVMEGLEKLERECLAWKGKIALFKNLELGN